MVGNVVEQYDHSIGSESESCSWYDHTATVANLADSCWNFPRLPTRPAAFSSAVTSRRFRVIPTFLRQMLPSFLSERRNQEQYLILYRLGWYINRGDTTLRPLTRHFNGINPLSLLLRTVPSPYSRSRWQVALGLDFTLIQCLSQITTCISAWAKVGTYTRCS